MALRGKEISIGELARRTGLAHSAIRYYEDEGLVHPERTAAGQRRFLRSDIRRLSFVMIAQRLGFSLARVRELLHDLPERRTRTRAIGPGSRRRFAANSTSGSP
ncbi:MAG: MerR family transcriptional regulator [Paracoccaceae bacterium]